MTGIYALLFEPVLAFGHIQIAGVITAIAAVLIGIRVIWLRGVKPIVEFVRAIVRAADALEEAVPTLREIADEFKPNTGRSLVDVIRRMDKNIHTNAENAAITYRAVTSIEGIDPNVLQSFEPLEDTPPPENK